MRHLGTIRLETERLLLRRFTPDDAEAMFANWASDPDVARFLSWPAHKGMKVTEKVLSDWVAAYDQPDTYQWGMEIRATGELIGSIGVVGHDKDTSAVKIGYCIGKVWWNRGYTSEALIELVRFFFEEVGTNRIEACYDPRNPNSGKVMQKAGMRYEGTLRESLVSNQGLSDAAYCAILARDYSKTS
ncbi:MAG: GNAT family N-acetyltransferase [Coriobacteriales bacterium]|jgi:ribosomal-protein-alanine N-acetyltransferase|nr:GNAT family N-acetyltransferase [Coriobacteriales bacterium]